MNKRSMALLERAFAAEIENGLNIIQSKSKLAGQLVADRYLIEAKAVLGGRFPVEVKGYRLTDLGRMAYCQNCTHMP